ncbi:MAG: N-acetyltransferase [Chitinispirillaceae bacterium]|nr:N-acetyltransferase [Chitinispirillaceae bacterium]
MEPVITHDDQVHRFVCVVEGHECTVEYDMKDHVMDVYRTFVHPDLRGRGIAEKLMTAASDHARANDLSVLPSCSYAVVFFRRHPAYKDLLDTNSDLESGGSCRLAPRGS